MAESQLDLDMLVATLDAKRKADGISWRELARQADVSASSLTRMQQGKRPDVDTFVALVSWLKMPAETFLAGASSKARSRAELLASVPVLLRGKRELSPDASAALEELVTAAIKLTKELK